MGHHVKEEDRLIEQLTRSMERVNRTAKRAHAQLQGRLPSPQTGQLSAGKLAAAAAATASAETSNRLQALAAPPAATTAHGRLPQHQLQLAQSNASPTAGSISQRLLTSESQQRRLLKVHMTPTQLEAHKKLMAQHHNRVGGQEEQLRSLVRHQLELFQHQQEEVQHTGHGGGRDHPLRLSTAHSDVWEHGSVHSHHVGRTRPRARSEAMVAIQPQHLQHAQGSRRVADARPGLAAGSNNGQHRTQQAVAVQQTVGKSKEFTTTTAQPLNSSLRPGSTLKAPLGHAVPGQQKAALGLKAALQPGGVPPTEAALKCLPVQDRPSNYKPVPSELGSNAGWWRSPGSVATKLSYPCTAVTDKGSVTPSEMALWESKMSELERNLRDERSRRQHFEQELKELQNLAVSRGALTTGKATAGGR